MSDIDKNRLSLFSEGDKEIIKIIDEMGDVTMQFKYLNRRLKELSDNGEDGYDLFVKEWGPLNTKIVKLEREIERPDAYNPDIFDVNESVKFTKKDKKKDAKTDTYDVIKSGTVIGQVKWSSRHRGYSFLPTSDCDIEIKDFVKDLMKKRREEKKKK